MVGRSTLMSLGLAFAACGGGSGDTATDSGSGTTSPTLDPTAQPAGSSGSAAEDSETDGPTGGSMTGSVSDTEGAPTSSGDPTVSSDPTDDSTTGTACVGLECQIDPCDGNKDATKIRGTVYAPEGTLPLYNVTVYVPNAPLAPETEGVTCDTCSDQLPGDPIVATLTDTAGQFVLEGVPSGAQIPLVIRVGKWRREITVDVTACGETVVAPELSRLPRNQSEGHMPRMALTTGGSDPFECLLRKLGIDDAEFTPPDGPGRVNLFAGRGGADHYGDSLNGGADFDAHVDLWNDAARLKLYDIVMLACEGGEHPEDKSDQAKANIIEYAGVGGRLFLEHWHKVWVEEGLDAWPTVATFNDQADLPSPTTAEIDTSFPKGEALSDWMINVGGSMSPGQMEIVQGQHTIDAVDDALATRWVYTDDPTVSVQYFTFNAPVGVPDDQQCGRVVDSDIHVSSGDQVAPFPDGCTTTELTPQEKALIFMFFELSSCLIPDDEDPIPG